MEDKNDLILSRLMWSQISNISAIVYDICEYPSFNVETLAAVCKKIQFASYSIQSTENVSNLYRAKK